MSRAGRFYTDEERAARLTAEKKKLARHYSKLDARTKQIVASLIDNAAFMAVTLEELHAHINKHGVVDEYRNGEHQWGSKKSPEVEVYNTMIKNYSSVMQQLTGLLLKTDLKVAKKKGDEFDEFVNDR